MKRSDRLRSLALTGLLVTSLITLQTARSAPSFRPPNGLAPETAIGTEKNPDGTAQVTLQTLQNRVAQNSADIEVLSTSSVAKTDLDMALKPYLTGSTAAALFATPAQLSMAVKAEADRAKAAEATLEATGGELKASSVTTDGLATRLAAYLTARDADARYATPATVTEMVTKETSRAMAAEADQEARIDDLQATMATRSELNTATAPLLTKDVATQTYASRAAVDASLANKLDRDEAARNYLPVQGGTVTGPLKGAYYSPACYSIESLRALVPSNGVALACYYDVNNASKPNLAVFALGAWHWVALGPAM